MSKYSVTESYDNLALAAEEEINNEKKKFEIFALSDKEAKHHYDRVKLHYFNSHKRPICPLCLTILYQEDVLTHVERCAYRLKSLSSASIKLDKDENASPHNKKVKRKNLQSIHGTQQTKSKKQKKTSSSSYSSVCHLPESCHTRKPATSKKSVGIVVRGHSPILICSLSHFKNPPEYKRIKELLYSLNSKSHRSDISKVPDNLRCSLQSCRSPVTGDLFTYSQKQPDVILFDYCCNDHLLQHMAQLRVQQWYNAMNSVKTEQDG